MKVFIDVGCNRGQYAFSWLNIPDVKIFAFEPNQELFEVLKQQESDKFKVFNYAIGTEEGVNKFNIGENDATSSLKNFAEGYTHLTYSHTVDVNVIRLDTFCKENGITHIEYIKVDAQGSDLDVLKSMGEYLNVTTTIMVEAFINNDEDVYEGEVKEDEVMKLLLPLGFFLTNRAVDGNYADLTFVKL